MAFTFACSRCASRKYFSNYTLVDDKKMCDSCSSEYQNEQAQKKQTIEQTQKEKKQQRRKENEERANQSLKEQLENEKKLKEHKQKKATEIKQKKDHNEDDDDPLPDDFDSKPIRISLEDEAISLSKKYHKVLYVFVDMKHIKVHEWIDGKKRVILNKIRELRRTHKGGYSQEKFQRFIDMKKKKTPEWIEEHLIERGVLRGPYDQVIVEASDARLENAVNDVLKKYR